MKYEMISIGEAEEIFKEHYELAYSRPVGTVTALRVTPTEIENPQYQGEKEEESIDVLYTHGLSKNVIATRHSIFEYIEVC